ncbi:PREDICTED: 28S ribosomal protein S18c, mitochondrial [Dinoponera quadriceps]|uniref:28S ribosomal protein S18c, mitochondrial n=1 Tax=Dinoponera quadriceps TaxID=609295 RepID=A0A6P3XEK7_DINQU|nr:PREDICTED: 28S ribosomal protein S18c, mitochondrial [Dinoponera quadriceps]
MISPAILGRISTFVAGKFYKSCFRTISKSSTVSSTESNVMFEDDMPIKLKNPYVREKRQCILCRFNVEPDYKNVRLLSQFQSRYTGKTYEKHITGLCEYKQKRVEEEIIKAQNAGLMGYVTKEPEYVKDPPLFDPNHPFKPNKF